MKAERFYKLELNHDEALAIISALSLSIAQKDGTNKNIMVGLKKAFEEVAYYE